MRDLSPCCARLPTRCHVVMPGFPAGANVFISVRGRDGLETTGLDFGDDVEARRFVRAINELSGIAPVEEHAMLAGAMLGWDSSHAHPDYLRLFDARFASPPALPSIGP